jgi:ABC-type polysaccharide/polyol phosphate export permease
VTSFFRTGQGAKGLNGLVNGIIPQISGIYFPLAMLPESFVSIINLLPFSHGISLLRKELVYTLITNHVSVPENIVELDSFFGGEVIIFGYELTQFHSIIILLTYALIFMFLGVQKFRNEKL